MESYKKPKRLIQIEQRAEQAGNERVKHYVTGLLAEKMEQAGPHAGIWLETLESSFNELLLEEPQGAFEDFSPKDFDDLFRALFGYERPRD